MSKYSWAHLGIVLNTVAGSRSQRNGTAPDWEQVSLGCVCKVIIEASAPRSLL